MKKNCINCKNLDYYEKETPESFLEEGFVCMGREYKNESQEYGHFISLQSSQYRERGKKCCVLTQIAPPPQK